MKFAKTMLHIGRYHSPDGIIDITPDRLKHWEAEHSRLTSNGYVVPTDWDHSAEGVTPMSSGEHGKRSAANTVGKMTSFTVNDDGNSATLVTELHDEAAKKKASDNTIFASPVISRAFRDGGNNEYEDLITHFDLVNYPVDYRQGPFERSGNSIAMSLGVDNDEQVTSPPVVEGYIPVAVRMSATDSMHWRMMAADDDDDDKKKKKKSPGVESSDDSYSDDYAGDDDYDDDYADDYDEDYQNEPDMISPDVEPKKKQQMPELDESSMLDEARTAEETARAKAEAAARKEFESQEIVAQAMTDLEDSGIAPPRGVDPIKDPHSFLAQLCASLRQKKIDEDAHKEESTLSQPGEDEVMAKTPEYAQMSLKIHRQDREIESLKKEIESRSKREAVEIKKVFRLSLDELLKDGKCTAHEHKSLVESLSNTTIRMSAKGEVARNRVSEFVQSRKTLPVGAALESTEQTRMSSAEVIEPPSYIFDGMSKEEVKSFVDKQVSRNPTAFTN